MKKIIVLVLSLVLCMSVTFMFASCSMINKILGKDDPADTCEHVDADEDGLCDECGAEIPADDTCEHRDANDDNLCDKCGEAFSDGAETPDTPPASCEHRDANDDDLCDKCGEAFSDGAETPDTPDTPDGDRENELPEMPLGGK